MSDWTLHLGDCIAGMRAAQDDSFDVSISDAPYDEHTHSAGRTGKMSGGRSGSADRLRVARSSNKREKNPSNRARFNRTRDLGFPPITTAEMAAVARELARTTRRWSLLFCSIEMISDWRAHLEAAGLQYVRTCVWHKLGSTPQFTGDRPAVAVEAIVCAHRAGRKRWNGGGKHGYYAHPIVLDRGNGIETRCHTTQKPLSLMLELVADFSDPGELVLDAFCGSGTTGVACRQLGRRFIGFEIDPKYHAIAQRRLAGEEAQPRPEQPSLFSAGGL